MGRKKQQRVIFNKTPQTQRTLILGFTHLQRDCTPRHTSTSLHLENPGGTREGINVDNVQFLMA